jgi:hypothetical protein
LACKEKKMPGGSRKLKRSPKRASKKRSARRKYSAYQRFIFDYYDILQKSGCNNMKNWMKIASAAYRGEDVSDMCYI